MSPGVIVISSLALWTKPNLPGIVGEELAGQSLVVSVFLLILAYGLGLIIATLSWAGATQYTYNKAAPRFVRPVRRFSWRTFGQTLLGSIRLSLLKSLASSFLRAGLWLSSWLPLPTQGQTVELRLQVSEALDRHLGLAAASNMQRFYKTIWDFLATFRTVISGTLDNSKRPVLSEAEAVHRRLLFGLGVGFALLLLAVESLARLVLYFISRPQHDPPESANWLEKLPVLDLPLLCLIIVFGLLGSFALRWVAGRWWVQELLLTSALTR